MHRCTGEHPHNVNWYIVLDEFLRKYLQQNQVIHRLEVHPCILCSSVINAQRNRAGNVVGQLVLRAPKEAGDGGAARRPAIISLFASSTSLNWTAK